MSKPKKKKPGPAPTMSDSARYDRHKAAVHERDSAASKEGRDVADDRPDCANTERRGTAATSLEFFCRTYFPHTFNLPWSPDHRTAIKKIEVAVLDGGQFAYAMPRGSGKTTLAETAAIWATLYGYRQFVLPIGSDQGSALQMLDSIKVELSSNDLLDEDFHWTCWPIQRLEGIAHRCNGQLWKGERTHVHWTNDKIVLPTIPGSISSGAIIGVAGLTGGIRGKRFKRPDGRVARPDLAILDDPQTDDSARSPSQVVTRERLVAGAVLGLAGPGKKIAAVMPCTVIAPGDLADRLLNKTKHPEWQGERAKLIYAFPTNEAMWEQYARIRADSLRAGNGGREATEFYVANREAMDAGSQVAWPARFNPDEVSALQYAMNLKLDLGESAFAAEYQNEPLGEIVGEEILSPDEITKKLNGVQRGLVPLGCDHLTAFIDVQGKALYWVVAAFGHGFTGAVIDYGAYPDQKRTYFALSDVKRTLAQLYPKAGQEGQIYAGLEALKTELASRVWRRTDGAEMRLSRGLIDANWGESTDTVYLSCRQGCYANIFMPSHGKFVGASSMPWEQYTRKDGETIGNHWMIPSVKAKRAVRHILIDTNFWKSFVHGRLRVAMGDVGCLSLYANADRDAHRMLADHLTAEYGVKVVGRGRTVIEWKWKPNKPDNHLFDCLVGCHVAASMLGVGVEAGPSAPRPTSRRRAKVTYLT